MAMYLMKPWYNNQKQITTTTWSTTSETLRCDFKVTQYYTRSGTELNGPVIYKRVADSYLSNSIRKSTSSSYSSFQIGMFGYAYYTSHSWTNATLTEPRIYVSGGTYNAKTTFDSWSKTAKSYTVGTSGSVIYSSWTYLPYAGADTTYTDKVTWYLTSLVSDYSNSDYFMLGWYRRDGYGSNIARVAPGFEQFGYKFADKLSDPNYISASATWIVWTASNATGYTYSFYYPWILAKYSDPYQIRQLIYTNSQYAIFEGNLTQTVR